MSFEDYTNRPSRARLLAEGQTIRKADLTGDPMGLREWWASWSPTERLVMLALAVIVLGLLVWAGPPPAELRSTDFNANEINR